MKSHAEQLQDFIQELFENSQPIPHPQTKNKLARLQKPDCLRKRNTDMGIIKPGRHSRKMGKTKDAVLRKSK
ncbi:MAG: hypothetical protein N3A69_06520 [Leptospiraceae bacterium]|nr:hypothetical protein [Leptospiraceae bacterium]